MPTTHTTSTEARPLLYRDTVLSTMVVPTTIKKVLVVLCFDMLSIGLIVPLITPFIRDLGATPSQIGMISSVYGFTQLLSSPVLGRMSDRLSRRSVLLLSLVGGAIGYLLLGFATSITMVVVSRVIVGIFRQTMTVTKAWVTDTEHQHHNNNSSSETSTYLSWFYATASLGFMIGPALGGKLAKYSDMGVRLPFFISTILFLLNALGVYNCLPSGKIKLTSPGSVVQSTAPPTDSKTWFQEIATLRPEVRGLMLVRFFIGISIMLSRSGIFMLMEYKLNMDLSDKGYIMSVYSIGGVVTQLVVVPCLVSYTTFTNSQLVTISAVLLAGCQLFLGLATTSKSFYTVIVGLAVFSSVLKVAMSNALVSIPLL